MQLRAGNMVCKEDESVKPVQITVLNTMAGQDFKSALDTQSDWGLQLLDLKDGVFGKNIISLTDEEAERAAAMIQKRGMSVYCLSTTLFNDDIEIGETAFRQRHLEPMTRAIEIAQILQPKLIRLIAAKTSRRLQISDSVTYVRVAHPWLFTLYGEAIELITDSGFVATVENETGGCLLSNSSEIRGYFDVFSTYGDVCFTWDVVNLWQAGTFPTLEVYESLKPIIGYYHLKGGRHNEQSQQLRWQSSLEHASWPVAEITRRVITDHLSPVICLNPPHGSRSPDGDDEGDVEHDLAYIRRLVNEEYQNDPSEGF